MKTTITLLFIFSCFVSKAYNHEIHFSEWEKSEFTIDLKKSTIGDLLVSGVPFSDRSILSMGFEKCGMGDLSYILSSDSVNVKEDQDQEKIPSDETQAANDDVDASAKGNGKNPASDRNVFAVGYQIGGWTLLGMNYEVRFSDYVGVHFGVGLAGYTLGAKVHFDKYKNSSFVNLSYKDGGFGLVQTIGGELGGRLPFSKNGDFGLHAQIGIGYIVDIDSAFASEYFDNGETPNMILTFGIGFSW